MSSGQNYLLTMDMDMDKVTGPLSDLLVVKVCTSMLCGKIWKHGVSEVGGSLPTGREGVDTILNVPSPLPTTLLFS